MAITLQSSTPFGNVTRAGAARVEPNRSRNDWSCKPQTKAVKRSFTPMKAQQARTFGIR